MQKKIYRIAICLLIIIGLLSGCTQKKEQENNEEKLSLLVKLELFRGDGTLISTEENEYDSSGNQTKHILTDEYGVIWKDFDFEYNDKGKLSKKVEYYPKGAGINGASTVEWAPVGIASERMYEYEYDRKGRLTKELAYSNGELGSWIEYGELGNIEKVYHKNLSKFYVFQDNECDASGNITKSVVYNPDGSIQNVWEYEYDSSGNRTKTIFFNGEYVDYTYDTSGNIMEIAKYESNGTVIYKIEYIYDASGNLITEDEYENGELISHDEYEYEYDDSDNLIRKFVRRHILEEYIYEYDDENNKIKEIYTSYSIKGDFFNRTETEFDKLGNVIKETESEEDGSIVSMVKAEYIQIKTYK